MNNENITYQLTEDIDDIENEVNIIDLLDEFEQIKVMENNSEKDYIYTEIANYDLNYNVKQLSLICEYYGLLKDIRTSKLKKMDIIEQIILFEKDKNNFDIVMKRKQLWYYIEELKSDKIMKRFVIWN
jgi:hypothetical protein